MNAGNELRYALKTEKTHILFFLLIAVLAITFGAQSCQNTESSQEITSEQLDGYWTADSMCQFMDGQSHTMIIDDKALRSMYYVYDPSEDCPLSIYVIQENQIGFEILRKEYAVIKNDSIKQGPSCEDLQYENGWILDCHGRVAISFTSESSGHMVYYYSRKEGDVAINVKKEVLNEIAD
jgi:hypothetical protein